MDRTKAEIGDKLIAYDIESNILDYGYKAFNDFRFDSFYSIKNSILNFISFIECFSKYSIEKNDLKDIWEKPEKFNQYSHENAEFKSIDFHNSLKKSELFTEEEIEMLNYYYEIRNKYVHYSLNSTNKYSKNIRSILIKREDVFNMFNILKRLLINVINEFDRHSFFGSQFSNISIEEIKDKKCPYKY